MVSAHAFRTRIARFVEFLLRPRATKSVPKIFSHVRPQDCQFGYSHSTVEVKDGFWRMRIRERDYYANGFAIGKLLNKAAYPGYYFCRQIYIRMLFAFLYVLMRPYFSRIRIPERYLQELQGCADATGLPYRMLYCMNFMFDVLKRFGMHCSSVAIIKSDETLVGRNTDLEPWLGRLALEWFPSIILDICTPGKQRYVHVTLGFFLGAFNGFNESGIAVLSHQIAATKERAVAGNLATTLLQRMLLEDADSLARADYITRANPIQRCISNLIVSKKERKSCVFEICPSAVATVPQERSFLCCVTHFRNGDLAKLHRKDTSASQTRLALMDKLADTTTVAPEGLIAFLRNCENGTSFRDTGTSPTNEGTFQSLIFDLNRQRIYFSDGDVLPVSLSGKYREVSIND